MANQAEGPQGLAEEDSTRAELYALIGRLLRAPLSDQDVRRFTVLQGDDSDLGGAFSALGAVARGSAPELIRDEYSDLFIGLGRGEVVPFASYYLTGFLNEKPLAKLRIDMNRLGIARAGGVCEPEDHIAALCEMMAGLITGAFGEPADLARQQAFFDAHIAPWAQHFFEDLETAESANFFVPVGTVGKLFLRIESQSFEMAA